jgi:hypothetical protein
MAKKWTLEDEISNAYLVLNTLDIRSDDYDVVLKHIDALEKIKKDKKLVFGLDSNILLQGCLTLFEIVLMLNYEQLGVISSKVLNRIKH